MFQTSTKELAIGGINKPWENPTLQMDLTGVLDEIHIHQVALSDSEIAEIATKKYPIDPGLFWLKGDKDISDSGPYGYHPSLSSGVVDYVAGIHNQAVYLSKTVLSLPSFPGNDLQGAFSIHCWVKPLRIQLGVLVGKFEWNFYLDTDGTLNFGPYTRTWKITSPSALVLSKWYHVAITRGCPGGYIISGVDCQGKFS
ncbi:LamG domain-containing protein [Patescibacteria group bacterium]|nr:LamG domain-containing protein [Patescibacteria group bacterium]